MRNSQFLFLAIVLLGTSVSCVYAVTNETAPVSDQRGSETPDQSVENAADQDRPNQADVRQSEIESKDENPIWKYSTRRPGYMHSSTRVPGSVNHETRKSTLERALENPDNDEQK
jgi:hypothetical protein